MVTSGVLGLLLLWPNTERARLTAQRPRSRNSRKRVARSRLHRIGATAALALSFALPVRPDRQSRLDLPCDGAAGRADKETIGRAHSLQQGREQLRSDPGQRRAQINSKQPLPNLPGQALYLARNDMMSADKDLTDALPSRIGGPNKFEIPPAYFDADNEPLLDEYVKLFGLMQAPPADAQKSDTPFKDVVDLGTAIARAKGLDAANAEAAGRISLGLFFAETNGNQNIGNARSNKYKGSFQTGLSEDQNGRKKWAAIKPSVAAFDPALILRDDKEEARAGQLGSSLQPLDRGARRADERPRGSFPASAGDREDAAGSDRSDEAVRTDPDHSGADQVRARFRQSARTTGFPTRRSCGICATTACSPLGRPTGQGRRPPSAKSSMRCGCSMPNSNRRLPDSTRSKAR